MDKLIEGKVSIDAVREVRYEDLLGREPVHLDMNAIGGYITGKRVMVTGGAGSIGSELCRQIAGHRPRQLIIVERNESGLYELELDLRIKHPALNLTAVLGAVQNQDCMVHVFETMKPQVVFHAAAYKHVPMMEIHPWEAVFNNIVGSATVLKLCDQYRVERCVAVSTDKAVRPTNVMGATKRLMEMLAQGYAAWSSTSFAEVFPSPGGCRAAVLEPAVHELR